MSIEAFVNGRFWTNLDEMVEDIEKFGFTVWMANDEYIVIDIDTDDDDDDDDVGHAILYLGHANSTMWVERVVNESEA